MWNPVLWNPEHSSRNPESHWRLDSRIQVPLTKTVIQYLESGIHGLESRIQDCLRFPYVANFLFISHLFAPSANIITRLPYVKATQGNSEVEKRLHNDFLFRRGWVLSTNLAKWNAPRCSRKGYLWLLYIPDSTWFLLHPAVAVFCCELNHKLVSSRCLPVFESEVKYKKIKKGWVMGHCSWDN